MVTGRGIDILMVMRDSKHMKVILGYEEYARVKAFEERALSREFEAMLDKVQEKNKNIDERKLDKVIKEALHASGRD
jgi:hypothetical protein